MHQKEIIKAEEIILGTILLTPSSYFEVSETISSVMFTPGISQIIASELFSELDTKGEINLQVFAYKCAENNKASKITYELILEIAQKGSYASFKSFCEVLRTHFLDKTEIELAIKTQTAIKGGEHAEDILVEIGNERDMIYDMVSKSEEDRLADLMEVYDNAVAASKTKGLITGIETGHVELNEITSGWQPTDFVVLAARPGMGKSTKAFEFARASAESGNAAVIFSLEMSKAQVYQKLVSMSTRISVQKIRAGELSEQDLELIHEDLERIHSLPLYVEDRLNNIDKIINKMRVLKRKHGIKMAIVDYIQLVRTTKDKSDTERVTEVSMKLKGVAGNGDCGLTLIGLAQLNRDLEKRGDKRPQLSDLRNSGQIEQDADMVVFIYRDEYYGIMEDEEGISTKGLAELNVAKYRHGMLKDIVVGFQGRFFDLNQSVPIPDNKPIDDHADMRSSRESNNDDVPF
jgi:replicative DNA helicase